MRTGSVHATDGSPNKPTPGWKSPHIWAIVPLILMLVVSITSVVLKRWHIYNTAHNVGLIGGAIIGVGGACGFFYLISLFFGWVARRSRLVLSISLTLLTSLSALGNSIVLYRTLTRTPPAVHAKIDKQVDQLISQFEAQSRLRYESGDTSMNYEGMARLAMQLRMLAKEYRGNDGEHLVGLAALYDALSKSWHNYSEDLAEAQKTWPLEPARIQSIADIETARSDLKELLESTVTLRDLMASPKVWVHDTLITEGIDSPEGEAAFVRGLFQNPDRRSLQVQSFDIDIEFVKTLLKMCDLLESQYGKWDIVLDDLVLFEDEASDQSWEEMLTHIQGFVIKQQSIHQAFINRLGE